MKLEQVVAIAVRLFALVVLIYSIRNGVSLVPYFYEQGWEGESYFFAAAMVLLFIVSILLWKFPLSVARGLVKFKEPGEADAPSVSAEQIQIVGFSILGLYLLFYVLSDIVYWVIIWFANQRNTTVSIELPIDQIGAMVSTVIEFIFVLFLLVGGKRIAEVLRKVRYGGDG
jgi:hypothetical protein